MSKKSFLRESVACAAKYQPQQLLVSDVISFVIDKSHENKLALLYFADVLQKASFGMSAGDVRDETIDRWVRADEASVSPNATGDTKISVVVTMMMDNQTIYASDDVCLSFAESISILAEAVEDPCSRGMGSITVSELMIMVGDLPNHNPRKVPFSRMAPVVEALHAVSGVSLCGGTQSEIDDFTKFEEWLTAWLKLHPLVDAYLDPPCVYAFDPVTGASPSGIEATMAALPVGGPHLTAAPTRHVIQGIAVTPHIWVAHSAADAKTIATHLRALHANPAGGGGTGNAMYIGRFSTGGVGFVWC